MSKNEFEKIKAREKRLARINAGLCASCGRSPSLIDKKECEECLNRRRLLQKQRYQSEQGPKSKIKIAEVRKERIAKGLCSACGKHPVAEKLTCETCLLRRKQQLQKCKDRIFEHYGGYKCQCCGETTPEFLMLDHINNDGADHRRQLSGNGSGATFYYWVIKNQFPPILQVLCANCNWGKRENGICPHQKKAG